MVGIKDKLKIEILEHNNEVRFDLMIGYKLFLIQLLPILIRDIGVDLKSGEDVALIRFDSFADFLVPKDVQADEIETLNHLIEYDIEHFLLMMKD